jgi:hypothetical protein
LHERRGSVLSGESVVWDGSAATSVRGGGGRAGSVKGSSESGFELSPVSSPGRGVVGRRPVGGMGAGNTVPLAAAVAGGGVKTNGFGAAGTTPTPTPAAVTTATPLPPPPPSPTPSPAPQTTEPAKGDEPNQTDLPLRQKKQPEEDEEEEEEETDDDDHHEQAKSAFARKPVPAIRADPDSDSDSDPEPSPPLLPRNQAAAEAGEVKGGWGR